MQLYDTNREQSKQFFGKTTQWFEKIIDWNKDSPELREYITALANAGNEERAAQLAKSLRLRLGQASPALSEIEAKYYADSQQLSSVVEVLESLCMVEPQNLFPNINLVTAL